ncbi:MAG: copper-binding protein [Candidatus Xenobia bacterium]
MRFVAIVLLGLTLLMGGCAPRPIEASAPRTPFRPGVPATGTVHGIGSDRMWVEIQQDPINAVGLPAGLYRYPVAGGAVLNGVHPGDIVTFRLEEKRGWYVVEDVLITHSGENDTP